MKRHIYEGICGPCQCLPSMYKNVTVRRPRLSKGPLALHFCHFCRFHLLSQGVFLSCVLSLGDTNKRKAWASG